MNPSAAAITVQTTLPTTLEKAWEYFTAPAHITQWYFANDTWHAPAAQNDLRAGGRFSIRMEAKDGSFGFDFEGEYTQVLPHELLAYSLADGRQVYTRLQATPEGVVLTQTFDPENENPQEMQREGWQMILNNLKKYVEGAEAKQG